MAPQLSSLRPALHSPLGSVASRFLTSSSPSFRPLSSSAAEDDTPLTVKIGYPFKGHLIEPPPQVSQTSPKELFTFFKDMSRMRRMELAADQLYKARLIRGFCHLYDGQEAVCMGMEAALTREDNIITAYRDHCTYLGRGGTLLEVFSELMGRKDGGTLGKGGSMHMYKKDNGFYGGHGIVGAQVPLGAGLAFGQKYEKVKGVTFSIYGDGGANQGQLFESLNIAALWRLPAVYVCENNHYGMGTADWRAAKSVEFYKRCDYVPGLLADGMNALAVKEAVKFAKKHALSKGPIVLELDTYRYHGHSMSDPGTVCRTRDEVAKVRKERDPIERTRNLILLKELATEADLKRVEQEIKQEVDAAIAKAKKSPQPDPSELFSNVYVKRNGAELLGCDRKHASAVLP